MPTLEDLLGGISGGPGSPRYEVEEAPRVDPTPAAPRRGVPVLGCLLRLVLMVVLLILFALAGLFLLFSQ